MVRSISLEGVVEQVSGDGGDLLYTQIGRQATTPQTRFESLL